MSAFNALETLIAADDTNGTSTTFQKIVALAVRYHAFNVTSEYLIDDVTMYNELKRQITNSSTVPLVPQGHPTNPKR